MKTVGYPDPLLKIAAEIAMLARIQAISTHHVKRGHRHPYPHGGRGELQSR
jgi:hypothetical protein